MPLWAVAAITAAATIGSTVVGMHAADKNAKVAENTAAENADLIRENRDANNKSITDQKTENTGLLTGAHDVNAGLISGTTGKNQGVIDANKTAVDHNIASGSEAINADLAANREANNSLYLPTYQRGQQAGEAIQALLGLGPNGAEDQQKALKTWADSAGMKFQLQTGSDAISSNKATAGLLKSGGALKALDKFGQDLGSTYEGKYLGYLDSQQQTGLRAADAIRSENDLTSSAYRTNTANNVNALNANASGAASATLNNNNNALGLNLNNNTGTATNIAGLNTSATNALVSGNTSATNALVGNNNLAAGVTSANNASASALSNGISGLTGNLVSAYGYSQGASSFQGGAADGGGNTNFLTGQRASGVNYVH